ncbi:MAG: hypothetical protein Tsb0020_25340 [Haliangiales bacterium]
MNETNIAMLSVSIGHTINHDGGRTRADVTLAGRDRAAGFTSSIRRFCRSLFISTNI